MHSQSISTSNGGSRFDRNIFVEQIDNNFNTNNPSFSPSPRDFERFESENIQTVEDREETKAASIAFENLDNDDHKLSLAIHQSQRPSIYNK
jgi:hypothetical protein